MNILKEAYQEYLLMCHFSGDIWWEYYEPFTYEEWIDNGQPDNPGKDSEYCKKLKR